MLPKLEELTLEQKLGFVLCARRFQEDDLEFIHEMIKKRAVACIQGYAGMPEMVKGFLDAADYPIIMVNDTEDGFPTTKLPKIPLNSLAACRNPEYIRAFAKGVVNDARNAGFNATWGPVIDVLLGDGPCSVHRNFSDNPETVSVLAEEIAAIYKQNHYLSCGKHYPGHGYSKSGEAYDTHMREGFAENTKEDLFKMNFPPYKYLLERGLLPSVMVGHTVYKNIDPEYPASLSKKVIDILRDEIGFDGVLFTDSFAMMGVLQRFGEDNIYGMAMAAGNDIILPNYRSSVKSCYERLVKNFEDGLFTEERLDEAVRRILKAMEFVGTKPENPTEFTDEDRKLLENVAKECITAVTDEGVSPALTDENEKLFIVMTDNDFDPGDSQEITFGNWYYPNIVAEQIRKNFPGAEIEFIPEFSNAGDHNRVLNKAVGYKEAVVITFCTTTCYLGTDGLTRRAEAWINALQYSGKISAIVHFGNPFALKTIKHIPRRIFGYMIPESQRYAIDVLAGKAEAKGTLPFAVELK